MTAILDITLHTNELPVSLTNISERQGLSLSYLDTLFPCLHKHKLLTNAHRLGEGMILVNQMILSQ
ncbi:Rrf2 family transcriptional regulator [Candidatus Erwinia haradaeae]|uniref:Rrf2 family transcriptional regulator n=1 Tax=Candidatus Erwinia haradaeae TaxID=1922217 RepID=UPI0013001E55|nr:Rrf2 family transcriptional regulator [Candidatus Erwinia haradaeae]